MSFLHFPQFGDSVLRTWAKHVPNFADFMKASTEGAPVSFESKIDILDEEELEQEMRNEVLVATFGTRGEGRGS